MAVEGEAVQFDNEALVGPEGVDLEIEDGCVEHGRRQLVRAAERREFVLEGRTRAGRSTKLADEAADWSECVAARAAGTGSFQRTELEQVEAVGLLEDALEDVFINYVGKIEESAGDRRDRDAILDRTVLRVDAAFVKENSCAVAGSTVLRRNIDLRATGACQAPKGGCAAMAEKRSLSTGKYGCQPASTPARRRGADGVDATMKSDKPASAQTPVHGTSGEAELHHLLSLNHAVLAGG